MITILLEKIKALLSEIKTKIDNMSLGYFIEYSTTEKIVGKWFDGRPVYGITLINSAAINTRNNTWADMTFTTPTPQNIDDMVNLHFASNTQPNFSEQFRISFDEDRQVFKIASYTNGVYPANIPIYVEYVKLPENEEENT